MDKKKLDYFKKKLLDSKNDILNRGMLTSSEDFHISVDDLADDTDLASNIVNHQVSFSMREKELYKLRMIDKALLKVQDGNYGMCEECEEPIGEKRLDNQPWSELCIFHAEEREREEARTAKRL